MSWCTVHADIEARFWAFVDKGDGSTCWTWTGRKSEGYGAIAAGQGKTTLAHRYSYVLHVGPIPPGLVIDHLCRNPPCVRPDHLEPVDTWTNTIARGQGLAAIKARATHCINGHEWTPENTYIRRDSTRGTRFCRECKRQRMRALTKRRKAGI